MVNTAELKLVSAHLEELRSLIQKLEERQDQIHQIDLDLALEKVRRIYDELCRVKLNVSLGLPEVREAVVIDQEVIKEEPVPLAQPEVVIEKEPEKEPEVIPELVVEAIIVNEEVKATEPETSLIDLFSASSVQEKQTVKKTIVEKMAEEKPVEILAEKIGKKKIAGLNQAIGINEKFFFINELFDGNMKSYKDAIDDLDKLEGLANAVDYLETLVKDKGWDKSKEAYAMLKEFIERRYS